MKNKKFAFTNSEGFWGYVFLAPAMIGFLLFTALPMIMSLYYSFCNYDGIGMPEFIGIGNYKELIQNSEFYMTTGNTFIYALGVVPVGVILALVVANLLNQKVRGVSGYRSAFFIPYVVSYVAAGMVWQWMFNQDYGLINTVAGWLGLPQPGWLSSEPWAMISVIIVTVWKTLGYNIVIILAALQNINPALYEAAEIDGANGFKKFTKVTVPMLRTTITFVTIMMMIDALQAFDQIYIMTSGGPAKSTQTLVYLIYTDAFEYFKQGRASALAYILFVFIFIFSLIQLRIGEKDNTK